MEHKDLEDRIDSGDVRGAQDHRRQARRGRRLPRPAAFGRAELLLRDLHRRASGISPPSVDAQDQAPGTGLAAGSFSKVNIELRRLQRVSDNFNLLLAYAAQLASKNLTAAEKMSLGGPNGVRAYPVGEAPGDTGQLATAELRFIVPNFQVFGGDFTLSTFVDYGQVKTLEEPPPSLRPPRRTCARSQAPASASLGREGNFLLRANVAWSLDKETPISDAKERDPRVFVQAIKWF